MNDLQPALSIGLPSLLVILSWIHNNARLSRVEAASDATNRRMDELQRSMHSDMLTFRAAVLGELANMRERLASAEAHR